jgi:hypothetical protein
MPSYEHPSYAGRLGSQATRQPQAALATESISSAELTALARADRSCCCVAKPVVIVFMPTATGHGKEADLLLCMHHYRACQQKLTASGARVVDASGALVTAPDPRLVVPRPRCEPG